MSNIEAILLTGGASKRMGQDKSLMEIAGRPIAYRIATSLMREGIPVTVLGREPLEGFPFQADQEAFAGPLAALTNYRPMRDFVFVVSCDLPLFEASVVEVLQRALSNDPSKEGAIPLIGDRLQPTCALYRSTAWRFIPELKEQGKQSLMAFLDKLNIQTVGEEELRASGIDPVKLRGANTPEDFAKLIGPV